MNEGARLLRDLVGRGLTQTEICEALGVTQSTVSRWLSRSKPDFPLRQKIQKYARRYGVSIPLDAWDRDAREAA